MMSDRVASFLVVDAGATIAIVDDDPGIRTALEQLLRSSAFNPVTYESAEEFLELGDPEGVSCLIVDVNLPGINGVELVKRLSSRRDYFPVILMTGRDDAVTEQLFREAGEMPKLRKPFSGADLFESIMLVMHR
jgi:FixJ family two-component response regulator